MTLIDEINESIRLGDAFGNHTNISEVVSDAESLLKNIKKSERDIINLFQDAKNMKEAGLISGDEISGILDVLREVKSDISDKNEYRTNYFNTAIKSTTEANDQLKKIWSRYILQEIGTQKEIVQILHIMVEDSQRYNTLSLLYRDIVNYPYFGSKDVLKKIETYKYLADRMVKDLNLKRPILRFFERMADRKVLFLSELTPEIWDWIQKNHFEDKFTIKISSNESS